MTISHYPTTDGYRWFVFDASTFAAPTLAKGFKSPEDAQKWVAKHGQAEHG